MDMPLATIRQVLAALETSPAHAETLVREYASTRERQIEQVRAQVQLFIRITQRETIPMTLEVNVKKIPLQQVVSLTCHTKVNKLDTNIAESVSALRTLLQRQNVNAKDAPFGIFHGEINEQGDGPIEICIPVDGNLRVEGDVQVKQLAGGEASCVMTVGAYDAAADWIPKNGYQIAESPREIWHSGPGAGAKLEILWLFK